MSNELLSLIDAEIGKLTQARSILASIANPQTSAESTHSAIPPKLQRKKKRKLSPEGRARIVEALKKRWASQKAKQKGKG